MLKKVVFVTCILLLVGSLTVYWLKGTSTAKLIEPIRIDEQSNNFILHVRMENHENGLQVLRSLEYIGTETITLSHRTPLIGLSINHDNPKFTGSPVTKIMDPGDIYHPDDLQVFAFREPGSYTLFVHCQLEVNGEPINIRINRDFIFK